MPAAFPPQGTETKIQIGLPEKWDQRPPWQPYVTNGIAVCAFLLLWWLILTPSAPGVRPAARNAELAWKLHAISLALERYAVDCQAYPLDLEVLRTEAYLPSFPGNPYRGRLADKMRPLAAGSAASPGDFVYIPLSRSVDGKQLIYGYEVYGYSEYELPTRKQLKGIPDGVDSRYVVFVIRQHKLGSEPQTDSSWRKPD